MSTRKIGKSLVDDETGEVLATSTSPEAHEVVPLVNAYQSSPFFKTPWNYDRDAESIRTGLECRDPTLCQQHLAHEADIKTIIGKFLTTGQLPQIGLPVYQDIEQLADLQDVIVTKSQVDAAWDALPTAVRNILRDPKTFADYVEHCLMNEDIEPLRELGLAKPKPPQDVAPGAPQPPTPVPGAQPGQAAPGAPGAATVTPATGVTQHT